MHIIKKFTAIKVKHQNIGDKLVPELSFGEIQSNYGRGVYPATKFDSEQEAIEYAFNENQYADWLILPIVSFAF